MRRDILFDVGKGEMELNLIPPPLMCECGFVREDDLFLYFDCVVPGSGNGDDRKLLSQGIGAVVPRIDRYKKLKVRFRLRGFSGPGFPVLNTSNNEEWFEVRGLSGDAVYITELPLLDLGLFVRFYLRDNRVSVCAGYCADLNTGESLVQNEFFLMQCYPSNLFAYPTTGVGLSDMLHGNLEGMELGRRIKTEFDRDGMGVNDARINAQTGEVWVDGYEL